MALLAGLASVLPVLVALAVPGGLLFVLLAPLPLFLTGLSMGLRAALIAGAAACLALGLLGGPLAALGILVTLVGPVAILVRQALLRRTTADGDIEWYPPGLLATWLAGIGAVLLVFSALMQSGGAGIEATLQAEMTRTLALFLPEMAQEDLSEVARSISFFGLGASLDSWLLLLAVNGVLAQGVLGRFGRNLRPAPDITAMALPNWLPRALAGTALVALVGSGDLAFLSFSLMLVLWLPFLFAGLAVVHAACRRLRARLAFLVAFYVFLVLFTWPAVLLAGLGLIDHWAGFRRRLRAAGSEQEKE